MFNVIIYAICGIGCIGSAIMEYKNINVLLLSLSCASLLFRASSQEIDKLKK